MSIIVEGLSKKFCIAHLNKTRIETFREAVTVNAKEWMKRTVLRRGEPSYSEEEFFALQDVTFRVEPGTRLALMGKNGSGKSTLLKILSRVTPPSSGRVSIQGRVASLLEVGTGFHPELDGRENIFLSGAILGMRRHEIRKKFDEIVAFADVEKFLDVPVKRYSSGMYVRLAFSVAAHLDSDILILDEVLAVGDDSFRKQCFRKVESMTDQGKTILFVSHNIAAVKQLCNQGLLLDKGRLIPTQNLDHCIQLYHSGHTRHGALSWEGRMGNDHIEVTGMTLATSEESSLINREAPAEIEVKLHVRREIKDVLLAFHVLTLQGHSLMQWKVREIAQVEPGFYELKLQGDFSLLAEGSYRLELEVYINHSARIAKDIAISFDIIDKEKHISDSTNIVSPRWRAALERK